LPDACVLVARLHGVDALAGAPSAQTPQEALDLLGNWCTLVFDAVAEHGGEVIQFSGDGLMALFTEPQAALQAVRAAQAMVEVSALFNAERTSASA
jgi:class 3 adenylate cyclase